MTGAQLGMVFAGVALAVAIHVMAMAVCAAAMGIRVRSVSFGIGPTLLRLGRVQLRALPLAGSVSLKDSRVIEEDGDGEEGAQDVLAPDGFVDAFNHQPVCKQVLLPLAGVAALVGAAVGILGAEGWGRFLSGFAQVVLGAVSPFDQAQVYLQAFQTFVGQQGFVAVLGLTCAKLGAFNLLPLPALNGGQALVYLVKWGRPEAGWEEGVGRWSAVATLLLSVAWLLAIGYFGLRWVSP